MSIVQSEQCGWTNLKGLLCGYFIHSLLIHSFINSFFSSISQDKITEDNLSIVCSHLEKVIRWMNTTKDIFNNYFEV